MSSPTSALPGVLFLSFLAGVKMVTIADVPTWYAAFSHVHMAIPLMYAAASGCILTLWMLVHLVAWLVKSAWIHTSSFLLKHFIYPHIFRRLRFIGAATRSEAFAISLYVAANVVCVAPPWDQSTDMSARAGTMSVINIVPLLCGPRLILITQLLGLRLRTHLGFHKWIGGTAVAQALLHTALSIVHRKTPFTWTRVDLSGVVVCPEAIPPR
jgi:hypothetical protein